MALTRDISSLNLALFHFNEARKKRPCKLSKNSNGQIKVIFVACFVRFTTLLHINGNSAGFNGFFLAKKRSEDRPPANCAVEKGQLQLIDSDWLRSVGSKSKMRDGEGEGEEGEK